MTIPGRGQRAPKNPCRGPKSHGSAIPPNTPKEIIKEGLSEYFIYTVPGTETVKHTWSKRMRLFQGLDVPFQTIYRYRPHEYGSEVVRMFLLRNDQTGHLGQTPLPDGQVRLFRQNGRDGLSFVIQQPINYVPIGQEIELNLGPDPEIIHERVRLSTRRDNFWFHRSGANLYYSPNRGIASRFGIASPAGTIIRSGSSGSATTAPIG